MNCSICDQIVETNQFATEVFRRDGMIVTVTGIPVVSLCPTCNNAVLDWHIAQEVEGLIQPLFKWSAANTLPNPIISITFPEIVMA